MYNVALITIEVVSTIACFILLRFMIKPFRLTGETRYLGLPLGFGFLGLSYAFSALANSPIFNYANKWWIQLFLRAFAFLFLAVTYFFSKSTNKHDRSWTVSLGVLVAIFTILILLAIISPQSLGPNYPLAQTGVRVFNLICLSYITVHVLKSHTKKPDATTLTIPFGYIFIGMGQYSQIIASVDNSALAFWTGLALRLAGLAVFLFVSYGTFYSSSKKVD
jgi:hypothetical protein